jgi:predicted DCC family thiol-disulfide oxidoreductase YuxK
MADHNNDLVSLSHKHPILLYDGDCILCSRAVVWIINHDIEKRIKFCPLQSEMVNNISGIDRKENYEIDIVYLIHKGRISDRSSVTIQIIDLLGWPWKVFSFIKLIPKSIRDAVYDLIAKHRYKWFGYKKQCLVPDLSIKERFITF